MSLNSTQQAAALEKIALLFQLIEHFEQNQAYQAIHTRLSTLKKHVEKDNRGLALKQIKKLAKNKLLQDEAFKSVLTSLIEVIITWNECERENLFDALNALIGGEK